MSFWKKKSKRQTTVKQKTSVAPSKTPHKLEPKEEEKRSIPKPKAELPPFLPKTEIQRKPKSDITRLDPEKEFLKTFKQLCYRQTSWEVWKDFIVMFACSLSNPVDKSHYDEREALYLRTINKYRKNEQVLFPELCAQTVMALEYNPEQDFLGRMFMELKLSDEGKKQIFTPYSACQLMAEITMDDVVSQVKENGYISIYDPTCGAGSTFIAAIHEAKRKLTKAGLNYQNHILFVGQDIETTVALMCYIQISLLGVAGYIKIADSICEPMTSSDTLEDYWFTPMYFSNVWVTRRAIRKMNDLFKGTHDGEGKA